jgi:hypothetical protein
MAGAPRPITAAALQVDELMAAQDAIGREAP